MKSSDANFRYLLSNNIVIMANHENKYYKKRIESQRSVIEDEWEKEQEKRSHTLFNQNILNLAIIQHDNNELRLLCHPVEYKHYIAQRLGIELGITPIAVSGITFYQEKKSRIFYIGKRSKKVTQYSEHYEFVPSGSIDFSDSSIDKPIDYSNQLMTELKEELGIPMKSVKSHSAFCLIYDKCERVFDVGIEIEVFKSGIKINENEYTGVKGLPSHSIDEYINSRNMVNTSKILYESWRVSRQFS